jgi:thioredoxin 1
MPFDTPINATDASFQRVVMQASTPVMAVFWSPEQTAREELDTVLEEAAEAYAGDALVVKLDVRDAPEARALYNVNRLPQFLFFRGGRLVARAKGMPSMRALRPWIEYLLERGPKPTTGRPRSEEGPAEGGQPVTVTDATFDQVVLAADVPALVDFWASWCGPCRAVAPIIEELAQAYGGRVVVAKLDVDANQATARRYRVMSIPTLIFFRNGQEVDRVTGVRSKHVLEQKLEALI